MPQPPTPEIPDVAIYSYILFQPISMSAGALASPSCFPDTTIRDFKKVEWEQRISAMTTALASMTDKLVVNSINISAADCNIMTNVNLAALSNAPWDPEDPPTQDPAGRAAIHIKAGFWDGEPIASPSAFVKRENWTGWANLATQGQNVGSAHYFVISNATNGYFSEWRDALSVTSYLEGTPIDTVDPTAAGITARTETIANDTEAFTEWMLAGGPI